MRYVESGMAYPFVFEYWVLILFYLLGIGIESICPCVLFSIRMSSFFIIDF